MVIATLLFLIGIGINVAVLVQPRKVFPRFTEICKGCGCQMPPTEYPPAVFECPICQWMEQRGLQLISDRVLLR